VLPAARQEFRPLKSQPQSSQYGQRRQFERITQNAWDNQEKIIGTSKKPAIYQNDYRQRQRHVGFSNMLGKELGEWFRLIALWRFQRTEL
jgi:hypothetical protein